MLLVFISEVATRASAITLVRQDPSWMKDYGDEITWYSMHGGDSSGLYRER
jgi:hypothetical protein